MYVYIILFTGQKKGRNKGKEKDTIKKLFILIVKFLIAPAVFKIICEIIGHLIFNFRDS